MILEMSHFDPIEHAGGISAIRSRRIAPPATSSRARLEHVPRATDFMGLEALHSSWMLLAYREYAPPAGLESLVACLWENEPDTDVVQCVVPDGCVDLIWLADRELVIEGPDTRPRLVRLPGRLRVSGIRLRPGAAAAVFGIPMSELRDQKTPVPASLIWGEPGRQLEQAVADAAPDRRLALLADAVAKRGAEPDAVVRATAELLATRDLRVGSIADELGLSERHLHRRLVTSVGYGPKMLARVARLRRLLALSNRPLVTRALDAGYASQAHMNQEVRQLTGTTPVRFLKDAVFTAA